MDPLERWWLIEAHMPRQRHGSLSEADLEDLYSFMVDKGLFDGS